MARPLEIAGQDYADFESYQRRVEIYRKMTGEQRLELAFELWETACEITRAGIRAQFPNYTSDEVQRELVRRIMIANGAAKIISSSHQDS